MVHVMNVHQCYQKEIDAQRLRVDTAEAERDEWKRAAEMHEHDSLQSQQELAAAEQRIAAMAECLEWLRGCAQLRPTPSLIELIDAALNPNPEAESHE